MLIGESVVGPPRIGAILLVARRLPTSLNPNMFSPRSGYTSQYMGGKAFSNPMRYGGLYR